MKRIRALFRRQSASRRSPNQAPHLPSSSTARPVAVKKTSNGVPTGDGRKCGFHDAIVNGWFNDETGELARGFPIDAQDTVVDVGCGDGGAIAFAAARGAEVIAADIQSTTIEAVERKLSTSKARAYQAIVTSIETKPPRVSSRWRCWNMWPTLSVSCPNLYESVSQEHATY